LVVKKELEYVKKQVSVLVEKMSAPTDERKVRPSESVTLTRSFDTETCVEPVSQDNPRPSASTQEDTVVVQPGNSTTISGGYAAVATQLRDSNPETWKTVDNKRRPRKFVTGNSVADVSFKGVAKKVVVCVSRLELGTSADTVSDYLTANGIHVISCFEANSNVTEAKFVNVRLCVPQAEVNKVYNSDIWPMGVVVRPWKFKTRE